MKLKKAKIIIRSVSDIKKEWKQSLKGKVRSVRKEDEILVTGFDTVDRLFSKNRLEILKTMINQKPASISELAQMIERDFEGVHSDVKFLSDAGLVNCQDTGDSDHTLMPISLFSGIELDLAA